MSQPSSIDRNSQIQMRPWQEADLPALRQLLIDAVEQLTTNEYSLDQRKAWISGADDVLGFYERARLRNPFIAVLHNQIAGYSDLQPDGLIDHFFVAPWAARQGVGHAMFQHIEALARSRNLKTLTSHVSLTAQPFFLKNGFQILQRQQVERQGLLLENALMQKTLQDS